MTYGPVLWPMAMELGGNGSGAAEQLNGKTQVQSDSICHWLLGDLAALAAGGLAWQWRLGGRGAAAAATAATGHWSLASPAG